LFICIEIGVFSNQANNLTMYVNKKIELHTKCLAVLGMIGRLNERISRSERRLANWDRSGWDANIRLMWKREDLAYKIESDYTSRERLVNYYEKTTGKLHETAVQE